MFRRNNQRPRRQQPRRARRNNRVLPVSQRDPALFATTLYNIPDEIPVHTRNPRVTRVVRFNGNLNSAAPSFAVTYAFIATQDANDYSIATSRYLELRVQQVRAWVESPSGLSVAVPTFGAVLTETGTGYSVNDRGLTGSQYSRTGFRFSFALRSAIVLATSTTSVVTLTTDNTIPATTLLPYTIDITVEFI